MATAGTDLYGTLRIGSALLGMRISNLAEVCTIPELLPLLAKSDYLLGGMDLRGQMIPVLDLSAICGFAPKETTPKFAAILQHNGLRLGIGIDEIAGLASIRDDRIQEISGLDDATQELVVGTFLHNGQIVTVADIGAIFGKTGAAAVRAAAFTPHGTTDNNTRIHLTFEVGRALFSIPAVDVYATVPRRPVERNSLTTGVCLGSIDYHNRRIPILNTAKVFGIGLAQHQATAEYVIVRFPDDNVLGFAVDSIRDIQKVGAGSTSPSPTAIRERQPFLSAVKVEASGNQIYYIDVDALRRDDRFLTFAGLSQSASQADEQQVVASEEESNLIYEKGTYLVYDVGKSVVTPLDQIVRILEMPTATVPLTRPEPGLLGFFSYNDTSVPLIRLADVMDVAPAASSQHRVLLVGPPDQQVGFLVDRVRSIGSSVWRNTAEATGTRKTETVVQLKNSDGKLLLTFVDLLAIAQDMRVLKLDAAEVA